MHELNLEGGVSYGSSHATYLSVVSALEVHDRTLFIGSSSVSGDIWGGYLAIYNLNNSRENYFGSTAYENEFTVVDDISQRVVTETTFDSSVTSISPLNLSYSELNDAVVVGLNDGSVQLVTLRKTPVNSTSYQPQLQPLTINSATYHDWPLEKVLATQISGYTNSHLMTLDISGCVKLWDCQSLMPIKSWIINSTTWPVNGSAFYPDMCLQSTTSCNNNNNTSTTIQNNSENILLSTLNPLDLKRKICLWDIRVNDITNPIVIQSNNCSTVTQNNHNHCNDLPTAINWFSPNHLLVGTYEGHLLVYDIRNPNMELSHVDATQSSKNSHLSSHQCKQIVQILTYNNNYSKSSSGMYIGLLQINGSMDVYQHNVTLNNDNDNKMLTHVYHYCDEEDKKSSGRIKPCGLFLSSNLVNHSQQPWSLLLSTGILPNDEISLINNDNNNNNNNNNNSLYTNNHQKTIPIQLDYQLRVHPNLIETNVPGFKNLSRIHYIKFY
ncbi:unnamed protein product [Schistosoma turkestanicum]|nr:unnamed protein product [Schistosoma turkestanicum]